MESDFLNVGVRESGSLIPKCGVRESGVWFLNAGGQGEKRELPNVESRKVESDSKNVESGGGGGGKVESDS